MMSSLASAMAVDGFAARHLAQADVARAVSQQYDVAGEPGRVGAAQVEQHAVLPGHRYDLYFGDDGRVSAVGRARCAVHDVPGEGWWAAGMVAAQAGML